ncbi:MULTISPECIES: SDR family NAD(P)-dependent oxidoreductase [unclassified Streptomyces]|uniref:SDR family NAD(P)-dependent oxidoreductase n=1 Tax=unclassified Streptomyces TaxID=2593676 RepID=UPI000DDA40A3|nr:MULTISPECIES: SDR family oxidoreductase [unclassified Streptomyces]QZZ28494.1 SDR family oxidoreductase [Streptomyces sp. ST1015]
MIDTGLSGKNVLVTGGAGNIGGAISRAFAAQGARMAVHYLPGDPPAPDGVSWAHVTPDGAAAVALARELGDGSFATGANLSRAEDLPRLFDAVTERLGYGTSKAALEALTRALALDLGPRGIRVNAVAPGPVQTGWMDEALAERVAGLVPLGRVGEPGDIADAVVFLASHQARWITGQVVQVAGGHAL